MAIDAQRAKEHGSRGKGKRGKGEKGKRGKGGKGKGQRGCLGSIQKGKIPNDFTIQTIQTIQTMRKPLDKHAQKNCRLTMYCFNRVALNRGDLLG
jgi:hypothetical protein